MRVYNYGFKNLGELSSVASMKNFILICYLQLLASTICQKLDFVNFASSYFTRHILQNDACIVSEIRGGFNADPTRYPYMVSLQQAKVIDFDGNKKFLHFCGGTLISRNLILTAAHCIWLESNFEDLRQDKSSQGKLVPNTVWAALNPYCRHANGLDRIPVTNFYLPKDYDGDLTKGSDIILLQTSEDFTGYQGPYCNYDRSNDGNIQQEQDATVLGWGAMSARQTRSDVVAQQNDPMQEATLRNVDTTSCSADMKRRTNVPVDLISMLCFSDPVKETGVCVGDSGGPLLIKGDNAAADVEIGLTSWSAETQCSDFELPFVFTKISIYADWIDGIKVAVGGTDAELPAVVESTDTVPENTPVTSDTFLITTPQPSAPIDIGKCAPEFNTKLNGSLLVSPNVQDESECCDLCDSDAVCNVWVYCPAPECLLSFNVCYLYYSDAVAQGNKAQVLGQGDVVHISGQFGSKKRQDGVCEVESGANYQGVNVSQPLSVETQERCCDLCVNEPFCNVFTYCPRAEGCRNPKGALETLIAPFRCDLKYQQSVANGQPPKVFSRDTDFVSGIVENKDIVDVQVDFQKRCNIAYNANARGVFLYGLSRSADSAFECCAACQSNPYCNVWVYCPTATACPGSEPYRCDLKFQATVANQEPVQYFEKGPQTPYTSGSIPSKIFSSSCIITTNINYQGTFLLGLSAEDEGECCDKCKFYNGCNVFVFCGKAGGCRNRNDIIPYKTCDLKYQVEVQNFRDPLNFREGFQVDFSGGIIPGRGLQQDCIKFTNSNLMGVVLTSYFVNSADECCTGCNGLQQCNVWVYCDKLGGCLSGKTFVKANVCYLKFQQAVADGDSPMAWEQGPKANFTSGFILGKLVA
eukprot:TRINITY_DN1805_c0_g1_i1.p1 TRINITY_DN1805_c0_g1~~TRINITY_DN1805_c0_g1_i1.p1  ORF type:complete len:867 (+),score=120.24 TRINITY_DN1805_c0_g1_i1:1653-4253(+)